MKEVMVNPALEIRVVGQDRNGGEGILGFSAGDGDCLSGLVSEDYSVGGTETDDCDLPAGDAVAEGRDAPRSVHKNYLGNETGRCFRKTEGWPQLRSPDNFEAI